jgi:hypothetical protein
MHSWIQEDGGQERLRLDDRQHSGDGFAARGDDNLGALRDPLEVPEYIDDPPPILLWRVLASWYTPPSTAWNQRFGRCAPNCPHAGPSSNTCGRSFSTSAFDSWDHLFNFKPEARRPAPHKVRARSNTG